MNSRTQVVALRPTLSLAAVMAGWLGIIACLVGMLLLDNRLASAGYEELATLRLSGLAAVAPFLSSAVVGSALALRRPGHPVGWLFLLLGTSLIGEGVIHNYALYGAIIRPGSLPAAELVAVIDDITFIPWLTILGLIMLLTPAGHLTARSWRLAAWLTCVGGVGSFMLDLFRPYQGELGDTGMIRNPLEIAGVARVAQVGGFGALILLHVGVLMGAVSLFTRYRAARGEERLQLRWLGWSAVPFTLFVAGAFIAATFDREIILGVMAVGFVTIIPVTAGLAIEQYHLYDIERLISRGLSWILLSATLVACYGIVVVLVGQSLGEFGGNSSIPAVVATLAAVSILNPTRHVLQVQLDRHFSRRRYDAVAMIRRFLHPRSLDIPIESGIRDAVGDEALEVDYWVDDREQWVNASGFSATPPTQAIEIRREGHLICAITCPSHAIDQEIVQAVASEALVDLENARLQAKISVQLVEVRESRTRIVAAQLAERRRIERNLHDGAQPRLLAIALQLRAAEVGDDPQRIRDAVNIAVGELGLAVQQLRDLANGLLPSVLSDGGLSAAFDDLASRIPVPVRLCVNNRRYSPAVEETAWFIGCEAITNAVKHGCPQAISITVNDDGERLSLVVEDDGAGGVTTFGNGLRGIADRAEALGGYVTVSERKVQGTIITAELPCVL
jgi:signal transduction histidine kinase